MITVKPSQLLTLLKNMISQRLPLLITGAPGIGKTQLVATASDQMDHDMITSYPALGDPTDAKGLPMIVNGAAVFSPIGEVARVLASTKPTVWFIDEIGQATPAVQTSYMPWILAREVNGHRLPDHVTIVAATNRRTDRAGVSGILEPVKSRFASIVELEADLTEWCNWALTAGISAELIAFLRFKPDLLSAFTPTADMVNSPMPRTWSHVDQLLKLQLPSDVQSAAFAGAVGEGAAIEFGAFLRTFAALPSIDAILVNPASVAVPSDPAVLYALSSALAHRATTANFDRIAEYVDRMVAAGRSEFGVLVVRDALTRHPEVAATKGCIRLACSDIGELISGQSQTSSKQTSKQTAKGKRS